MILSCSTVFHFTCKVEVFILLFIFFQFYSVVIWDSKVHYLLSSLFLLIITRSGRPVEIKWYVCILKSQSSLWVSFSGPDSELCIYRLFVWSNFSFLHNSQWIAFPTLSCLVLYFFSVLICCIRLLCDWSFRLYHHIRYPIVSYLLSLL